MATIALLPNVVEQFKSRFPKVKLRVIEGMFSALQTRIIDGALDFYVGPILERPLPRGLAVEKLFDTELLTITFILS